MAFEPLHTDHGIEKVSVVITLQEPLAENYKEIAEKIMADKALFNQYEPMQRMQIKYHQNQLAYREPEEVGFKLTDKKENPSMAFFGLNEDHRTALIFTTSRYTRWKGFFKSFKTAVINTQKAIDQNTVLAIGLEYVDCFNWNANADKFSWEALFKNDTTMLPQDFFKHTHLQYNLLRNRSVDEMENVTEQLEILRSDSKTARIRHHVSAMPTTNNLSTKQLNKPVFLSQIETLHAFNKNVLRKLLTEEMVKRVGLDKTPLK